MQIPMRDHPTYGPQSVTTFRHRAATALGLGLLTAVAGAQAPNTAGDAIDEIVVTAQRRGEQRLQDLAMSAAVISATAIDKRQLDDMDDYLRTLPGVTFQQYGAGQSSIIIRGVSADPQLGAPTTGVYINEAPVTGMGDFGVSSPDLKLVDISRIEILRGPQGTLYGSSSLGGTVRVITGQPDETGFAANLSATGSVTAGAGSENSTIEGMINLPLIDNTLAVRAVAYHFDDSGYYRNIAGSDPVKSAAAARTGAVAIDRDDAGSAITTGGRIALRWMPLDQMSVDLTYAKQRTEEQGNAYGDLAIGDFEQARYTRLSNERGEYNDSDLSLFNLQLDYNFGAVALVSSTSWADYSNAEDWNVGRVFVFATGDDSPLFLLSGTQTDRFVQEIRVVSQWAHALQFTGGVYFESNDSDFAQDIDFDGDPAFDPFGGALLVEFRGGFYVDQKAVFGELSWAVNDSLVATAGARWFEYDGTERIVGDGIFNGGPVSESNSSSESDATYKLNLSYAPDERALYYAQWSQGFNLGRPLGELPDLCDQDNDGLVDGLGVPAQSQLFSDSLDNYEFGAKLNLADGRIALRGAAFYNDWQDIPISIGADCGFILPFNAGEAMTAGLELEGSLRLGEQWRLDLGAGYVESELTADAPGLGVDGDRLPGNPRYNATLALQYDFRLRGDDSYLRADIAHVGGYYNNLQEQGEELGDYTTVNLSAGLSRDTWRATLFVHNLGDNDAATWLTPFNVYSSAYRLRPRTVGVQLTYGFAGD